MVTVDKVEVYKNEICPQGCIRLFWYGDIGFGQYDLVIESEVSPEGKFNLKVVGYSECLDKGDDKGFLEKLLASLVEQVEVVE